MLKPKVSTHVFELCGEFGEADSIANGQKGLGKGVRGEDIFDKVAVHLSAHVYVNFLCKKNLVPDYLKG